LLGLLFDLKMEALLFSKTSVNFYQTTPLYGSEDGIMYIPSPAVTAGSVVFKGVIQ
jgi:hypothetical protein